MNQLARQEQLTFMMNQLLGNLRELEGELENGPESSGVESSGVESSGTASSEYSTASSGSSGAESE
jgi:hypothetical protein